MKKAIALVVLLEISFISAVNAGPTVTPGVYRFGNCGGVQGDSVPSVEREYEDRYLCESTYEQYGPGACHAAAELYAQEFVNEPQKLKDCEARIDRWEESCKQFVRQAAKQCASLKTTEQLQEEENRSSQNERGSAKDKFKQATEQSGSSSKDKFANLTVGSQHIGSSEAERQADLDAMHQKIEQAKQDTASAWSTVQQQAQLKKQKERELERLQSELTQRQAQASYSSSSNHDSSGEVLSTLGSVLMGVAQGAAAAAGHSVNMPNHGFSSSGRSGKCRTIVSSAGSNCPPGNLRCAMEAAERGNQYKTICQ